MTHTQVLLHVRVAQDAAWHMNRQLHTLSIGSRCKAAHWTQHHLQRSTQLQCVGDWHDAWLFLQAYAEVRPTQRCACMKGVGGQVLEYIMGPSFHAKNEEEVHKQFVRRSTCPLRIVAPEIGWAAVDA